MADKKNSTFEALLEALTSSGQYAGETGIDALRGAELGIPFLSRLIASATDETGSQRINRLQKEIQDSPVASRVGEAIPYLARMNPVVLAALTAGNIADKSFAAGRKGKEAAKDAASGATQSIVADTIQRYGPGITKVLPALYALSQSENVGADLLSGAIIKGGTKGGAALLPKTGSDKSVSMIARQLKMKNVAPGSIDEKNLRRGEKSALWDVATASGGDKGRYKANKDAMNKVEASRAETIKKAQASAADLPEAKNPGLINLNEFTQETLDAILNPEKRREIQPNFKGSGRNLAVVKPQQEEFVTALRNFEERQGYTGPTRAPLNLQESSKLFEALKPQADSGTLAGRQVLGHKMTEAIGSILGEKARDEYVTQGSDFNTLKNLDPNLAKAAGYPEKSLSSEIQSAPALATGGGGTKALDNAVQDVSQATGVPKGFLSGLATIIASQVPNVNKDYITPLRLKGSAVEIPGMGGTQLGDVLSSVATGTEGAVGRGLLAEQQIQSSLAPLSEEEFNALSDEEKIQLMQN